MTATIPLHQGTVTIPEFFTTKFGFKGVDEVIVEDTPQGILLKPKPAESARIYTDEEMALFEDGSDLEPHRAFLEAITKDLPDEWPKKR